MNDATRHLEVSLGERSYPITIGERILCDAAWWKLHCPARRVGIVTNTTVAPLYAETLENMLQGLGKQVLRITLPDGEGYKNWDTLNLIFDALLEARCDRSTTLIALGGGVIGDMTGFAAATYQRGIPFIQVPTTLLAQVDSSVGGKTGINHPRGKNMIGAFYQPRAVLMDVATLQTLPERELSAGLAEVIKHAAIADADYFEWLESNMDALRTRDPGALTQAILRSCEIKSSVVALDEREAGLRAILNFGHTFGHAIEAGLGYGRWLHGEAVGAGMVQAATLSHRVGTLAMQDLQRLRTLIAAAGLPTAAPDFGAETWMDLMAVDKKASEGAIRYVLLDGLGRARLATADPADVDQVLAMTATTRLENLPLAVSDLPA